MKQVLQEIIQFPVQRAQQDFLLGPQREFELEKSEAEHFSKYIGVLEAIAQDLEESLDFNSLLDIKTQLIRPFTFFFDKGVEIGYEYHSGSISEVNIDFDNIFTGVHGDKVPTDLQLKVNSIIPQIVLIGEDTVQFASDKQREHSIDDLHILQGILISSLMLGLEYSLRNQYSIST